MLIEKIFLHILKPECGDRRREKLSLSDDELDVVTGGGSTSIVKSGIEVAGGVVTVDGENDGEGIGLASPKLLADEEGLTGGGDAVGLEVDVDNIVSGGVPAASDGNASGVGVGSLDTGEVGNVPGGVGLGILGGGGVGDDGRVGGPNSVSEVNSGNPDGVGGGGEEGDDFGLAVGGGVDVGGGSGDGRLDVDAVVVEGEVGRIFPIKANGDDVLAANANKTGGGGGLRIGGGGGSGS